MLSTLHAIADTAKPFDITAAMASNVMLSVRSLMAAAGIEPKGRMSVAEVDAKLANSRLNVEQRIAAKLALTRAGILD
jgi:hypothetical protein